MTEDYRIPWRGSGMLVKQKKNIEWSEVSINPITGCNGPGGKRCEGCYAERIAMRFAGTNGYPKNDPFKPTWHPERLEHIRRKGKATVWFFGSQCDWLDPGVKESWRNECLDAMESKGNQIFITLTKQYDRLEFLKDRGILSNVILGISVTKTEQIQGIEKLVKIPAICRVISFEPLLEDITQDLDLTGVDWVIIGARSKQNKIGNLPEVPEFQPKREWVEKLIEKARAADALVFMKPNLKVMRSIQEYPFEKYGKNGFIYTHKRYRGYRLEAEK